MPMATENGSESREDRPGARLTQAVHEDSVPAANDLDVKENAQSIEKKSNVHLHVRHLPTPSPSPSPRSTSPSVAVAISKTSGEPDLTENTPVVPRGQKHAAPFDKLGNPTSTLIHSEKSDDVSSPLPISKSPPLHELPDIPEEKVKKPRRPSSTDANGEEKILRLSAAEMQELVSAPESLPIGPHSRSRRSSSNMSRNGSDDQLSDDQRRRGSHLEPLRIDPSMADRRLSAETPKRPHYSGRAFTGTPLASARMSSYNNKGTPIQPSPVRKPVTPGLRPEPLDLNHARTSTTAGARATGPEPPSPLEQSIPLPPMSIPTFLQLELASTRPSPLYIYRSPSTDHLYESSKVKFERLLNFLLLPPQLEQVLYFGSLACLDAWLYTFTILPLRFLKAATVLIQWWAQVIATEARFIALFIYHGIGRMRSRQRGRQVSTDSSTRSRSESRATRPQASTASSFQSQSARTPAEGFNGQLAIEQLKAELERKSKHGWERRHRRTKSSPSNLSSNNKADLLQGAVIICSCLILMKLDASRMYHSIRGQAAIKLYVIYNVLEVCDRLFSALGQDIFECLFSDETLERNSDGRSKILRPLGMFILALIYNVIHAAALFYQVITLNVAVNSYSNALLTLLMSNQFVEIKSTVFKKFEKDNIFQLTCADVVERFQLWLMLIIIALRNIVEVGGLSVLGSAAVEGASEFIKETVPIRSNSILPNSFTILPSWSGEVLSPFLLVLGSEMVIDWIKHAYISKFNGIKPAVYQRYLDVLAKDYYTNAFVNQNLIKRLGLPVIPLSCLFIRSSVQTYHMFLATHLPPPIPSTATALSTESATSSPSTMAALEHFDNIIRKALGRAAYVSTDPSTTSRWYLPSTDDAIAALTMLVFFLGAFLVLLACKLVLGMLLLSFARNRYRDMKKREHQSYDTGGKRLGGWGMVEVDDAKKRWIYDDDPETLNKLKEKEQMAKEKAEKGSGQEFSKISRYEMSAKRIW